MPPKPKRGKQNEWKPNDRDRALIVQQAANGMTQALIARHHGIDPKTLRKVCRVELDEGKELHEGILLGRMAQLGNQNDHPTTAFNATRWQLAALHGYRDGKGPPMDDAHREEEQAAVLDELDAKLAPYMGLTHEQMRKQRRQRIADMTGE